MEKSLKHKTVEGVFWNSLDLLANQGVSLVIQIVLARLLVPEDFGLIGIVTVFISVAQVVVDSGFSNAIIRDIETTQEDYSTVFFFNLVVSVIMYVLLFFSATLIGSFYNEPSLVLIIRVISSVVIINSFGLIQRTMLTKNLDFKSQTIINVISAIMSGVIAIIIAKKDFGVWSLVFYTIIKQSLQAIMYTVVNSWRPSFVFAIESFRKFYSFGWKLLVSSLIDTIYANINNLIIGKIFTKDVLGYYTNASKFSNVAQQSLHGVLSKVSYPVLSKIQDHTEQLKNGYRRIVLMVVFVNFPLMIGLIVIAKPLITLLLGENWSQVIPYFQILCIPGLIFPLQAINLNILQVKGRTDLFLRVTIIKKIVSFTLILGVLIFKREIMVLLWVNVFDSFITYLINSYYSNELLGYSTWDQFKDIVPTLCVALLMGAIVYGVTPLITVGGILLIMIQTLTGIVGYIVLCKLFKIKELGSTLDMVRNLIKGILKK